MRQKLPLPAVSVPAVAPDAEPRFFMDHGLWHDRVTGQHLYTEDQYREGRCDAVQEHIEREREAAALAAHAGSDADPTSDPNAAPTPMNWLTKAARDVLAERQRQITAEGYAPEHDDEHRNGEMGIAAVCYALHGTPSDSTFAVWGTPFAQHLWSFTGWPPQLFRPKGKRHNLKIAAALLLAEMERRDRIDDVIWVPCRGCTDLAGCEDHMACLTLDAWEVKHG